MRSKVNWNWIGLYWKRFELTKLFSSNIDIRKWGFYTWNDRHIVYFVIMHFPGRKSQLNRKEKYCSKIPPRDIEVNSAASKRSRLSQRVHMSHTHITLRVALLKTFFSRPLAKLRIFLLIISSRVDKFLRRCVEIVQCLSSVATFSGYMFARVRYYEMRWGTFRRKTLQNVPLIVHARTHIVISIFTVLQNPRLHLFRTEFSRCTCARARAREYFKGYSTVGRKLEGIVF